MPEEFSGRVDFLNSRGNLVLRVDPDSTFAQILYLVSRGSHVMQLTNTGSLSLMGGSGETSGARLDGTLGWLFLGGGGDRAGKVLLKNTNRQDVIILDARDVSIRVGGPGNPGEVVVRDADGRDAIVLNGEAGDIVLNNADCAEDFDLAPAVAAEPGTVMVLDPRGALLPSTTAYDRTVAGVISGAGECRPALVLDRRPSATPRGTLALVGKVYCKVDAANGSVEAGDLLTTSPTPGHAMKATDPARAFGAVLGKALRPLREGVGLIPILVALQ